MKFLLEKIEDIYGLKLELLEKVSGGFLSENFILIDKAKKYFLKKYGIKTMERIKEVHSVKKYFSDGGIPVILPILTKNKESFFNFENNFYALFPFVIGKQIKDGDISDKAIISMAEMLAQIHVKGKESKLMVTALFQKWNSEKTLAKIEQILEKINLLETKNSFDLQALNNILLKKRLIESNNTPYEKFGFSSDHLVHGDYTIGNIFFDANDNVSFVFDFEKTLCEPRVFELFRSMIYTTFVDELIKPNTLKKTKLYLDTYLNIYPMPRQNLIDGLDAYFLSRINSIWVESEHYLNNNHRIDELLKTDSLRLKYFSENLEEFKKYLFSDIK